MSANYKFWSGRTDKRVREAEFNNLVLANNNFVVDGCDLTAAGTDMDVDVASGSIYINSNEVNISSGSVTLSASDPTHSRCDLIVVNSSGTISAITGTPASVPLTPSYTETSYVVLGFVIVPNTATTISTSDITQISIINDMYTGATKNMKIITEIMNGDSNVTAIDSYGNITGVAYVDNDGSVMATETLNNASFKSIDDLTNYATNSWSAGGDGAISVGSGNFVDGTNTTRVVVTQSSGTTTVTSTNNFGSLSNWIGSGFNVGFIDLIPKSDDVSNVTSIKLDIGSDSSNYRTVTLNGSSDFWFKSDSYYTGLRFDLSSGSTVGSPSGNTQYIRLTITHIGSFNLDLRELTAVRGSSTKISGEDFFTLYKDSYILTDSSKTIVDNLIYTSSQVLIDNTITGGY